MAVLTQLYPTSASERAILAALRSGQEAQERLAEADAVIVSTYGDVPTYGKRDDVHVIAQAFKDHTARQQEGK